jgi:CDP-diacylglycerol--glycerol-3-phosphate 3-phosphatidyltransferase
MTLYDIKPRFQALLRPLVKQMANSDVTANQVTLAAALISVVLGVVLLWFSHHTLLFLLLPLWMFLRMALNAIDGMLAREFNQQSKLGACLNELCDVIADAALYLPFAVIAPFSTFMVVLVIFLATLSEFAGVLGLTVGASRRYDGPLGKSDRAFIFGALGLWLGIAGVLPGWLYWLMPVLAVLLGITITNRVQQALAETSTATV